MAVNVRVLCRFRPINEREKKEAASGKFADSTFKLAFPDVTAVAIGNKGQSHSFNFDRVFDPNTTQIQVYEESAKQSIQDVLDGYNATIFTYGQTGSGKTFTMFGADGPELMGIVPRAIAHIFSYINSQPSGIEFAIKCSFLEIYMENIRDLLNPSKTNLRVRESPSRGIWVEGATEEFVTCEQDIADLIEVGNTARAVSSTGMNQVSSRSHSVFMLTIEQKNEDGSTKRGKLNLVDLAGSEKISKTGAEGQTLEEAKKINQSLSALGNCIHSLTEKGRGHIPYRDSKLTRILQESLGGNCKTTLIITASPHEFNYDETVSTCQFGARAKTIKNQAKVNQQKSVAELMALVEQLTKELSALQNYAKILEKQIAYMKSPEYDPTKPLPPELLVESPSALTEKPVTASSSSDAVKSSTSPAEAAVMFDPLALAEQRVQMDRMKEQFNCDIDKLKDELSEAVQKGEEFEKNYAETKAKLEEVTMKLSSVERELDAQREMNKTSVRLTHEKDKEQQIAALTIKIAELQTQNNILRSRPALSAEDADLKRKVQEFEEENSFMVGRIAELEERIMALEFKKSITVETTSTDDQKSKYFETVVADLRSQVTDRELDVKSAMNELKQAKKEIKFLSSRESVLKDQVEQAKQTCSTLEQLLSKSVSADSAEFQEAKQLIANITTLEAPPTSLPVEDQTNGVEEHKNFEEERLERMQNRLTSVEDVNKQLDSQLQVALQTNDKLKADVVQMQAQFEKAMEVSQNRHKLLSVELEDLKVKYELLSEQKPTANGEQGSQDALMQEQIKAASESAMNSLLNQRLEEKEERLNETARALQDIQSSYSSLTRDYEQLRLEKEVLEKNLVEERRLREEAQRQSSDQRHINEILQKRRRIVASVIRADADPKLKAKVFEEKLDFTQLRSGLRPVKKVPTSLARITGLNPDE
eukprot:TRINITY_DN7471_c0_g1_i1.p1 TRINITY_DN7471_c0_g1~~TRINITY_DN7471_c0_g1_i1.p1  ORF type:complete len:934 (-),score=240.86 TRINITY_DN7471_c0_g1_i1:200-3001(-)